jgi:hypothetical protein
MCDVRFRGSIADIAGVEEVITNQPSESAGRDIVRYSVHVADPGFGLVGVF